MSGFDRGMWFIIDAALPVTAVALIALLAIVLAGRRRAALRDLMGRVGIWLLLVAPLIAWLSPSIWTWPLPTAMKSVVSPTIPQPPDPSVTQPPDPSVTQPPDPSVTQPPDPSVTQPPDPSVTQPPDPSVTQPPDPSVTQPPDPSVTTSPRPSSKQPVRLPVPGFPALPSLPTIPLSIPKVPGPTLPSPTQHAMEDANTSDRGSLNNDRPVTEPAPPDESAKDIATAPSSPPEASGAASAATPPTQPPLESVAPIPTWLRLARVAIATWLAGVAIGVALWIAGWIRLAVILRRAEPVDPNQLPDHAVWRIQTDLPEILISDDVRGPAVAGVMWPRILLPRDWLSQSQVAPRDLACALRHECAHLVRGDHWTHAARRLVATLWWPHPLVWCLQREVRRSAEEMCDNYVLQQSSAVDYAESLLNLASRMAPRGRAMDSLAMFSSVAPLEARVQRLLDHRHDSRVALASWCQWMGTSMLLLIAIVASAGHASRNLQAESTVDASLTQLKKESPAERREIRNAASVPARTPSEIPVGPEGKPQRAGDGAPELPISRALQATALAKAPKDVVFFASTANHATLWKKIAASRAWKALLSIEGWDPTSFPGLQISVADELIEVGNLKVQSKELYSDLSQVSRDLLKHELFVYIDGMWESRTSLYKVGASYAKWLEWLNAQEVAEVEFHEIDFAGLEQLRFPSVIMGAQLRDPQSVAAAQRLTKCLALAWPAIAPLYQAAMPWLDLRLEEVGDDTFATVSVAGSDLPWHFIDRTPLDRASDRKLDDLIIALSKQRMTLAVGLRDDCLLISCGPGLQHVRRFGAADVETRLVSHDALRPLRELDAKQLTQVVYLSDQWMRQPHKPGSFKRAFDAAWENIRINEKELPPLTQQIRHDVAELQADIANLCLPRSGFLLLQTMDESGVNGQLHFPVTQPHIVRHRIPPVMRHLGDDPMAVWAWEGGRSREQWTALLKWTQRCFWYARKIPVTDSDHQVLMQSLPRLLPTLRALSEASQQVVGSIGDGGSAIVVHPVTIADRPGVSLQLVMSLADSKAFEQGMKGALKSGDGLWKHYIALSAIIDETDLEELQLGALANQLPRPHLKRLRATKNQGQPAGHLYWYDLQSLEGYVEAKDLLQPPLEDAWDLSPFAMGRPSALVTQDWLFFGTHPDRARTLSTATAPPVLPPPLAITEGEQLTRYVHINGQQIYHHFRPSIHRWIREEMTGNVGAEAPAPMPFYLQDDVQYYTPSKPHEFSPTPATAYQAPVTNAPALSPSASYPASATLAPSPANNATGLDTPPQEPSPLQNVTAANTASSPNQVKRATAEEQADAASAQAEIERQIKQAVTFYHTLSCLKSYTATEVKGNQQTVRRWRLEVIDLPR